jgi:hypothetical protein
MLKEAVRNCKVMYADGHSRERGLRVWSPNEDEISRHISLDHKIIKMNMKTYRDTLRIEAQNPVEIKSESDSD